MGTAVRESDQAVALFDSVETLEDVAKRANAADRDLILAVVRQQLAASPPLRPGAAAKILELSEKTVRNWVREGVLPQAQTASPRLLIDAGALHRVAHVVKEVREHGNARALLDEVYRRLVDATWLERDDLKESLEQMQRGQGTTRVPKPL
jgi:DNA-binding transcriptional MerR regulator